MKLVTITVLSALILFNYVQSYKQSIANHKFAANCLINEHAERELKLGYEYLTLSNYFAHDSQAYHGFSKLFKSYWHIQLENMKQILDYVIKRGGLTVTPHTRKLHFNENMLNNDINIKDIIKETIGLEKYLNKRLLSLSTIVGTESDQEQIRAENDCLKRKNFGSPQKITYHFDPITLNFLDENFFPQKVERIKYLSDLLSRISRFNITENSTNDEITQANIGVHLIDKELLNA